MKPGIYPELSNADYHGAEGIGSSRLRRILRSPAHFKGAPKAERKDAWDQGTLIHTAVLEPHTFEDRVLICDSRRGTKAWKEAEAQAAERGQLVCKSEPVEIALAVRDAVMKKPANRNLIEGVGLAEVSAFANDAETNILLRVRPDRITPDFMLDLKSTKSAEPRDFAKSVAAYGYHFQQAMYLDVWEQACRQHKGDAFDPVHTFLFLAVEKEPPYESDIHELDDISAREGHLRYRKAVELYAHCLKTDDWPGYPGKSHRLSLPGYAFRELPPQDVTGPLGFPTL